MREIMIKTTTSTNHKRKNLSITEIINQNGMVAKAEKKYCYYVSEQNPSLGISDMQSFADGQANIPRRKERHVSITKVFDKETGVGHLIYRVIGSFYVVQNLHVFAVVFMHTIKFDMAPKGTDFDTTSYLPDTTR